MKNNEKTEQQKEQAIIRATERWINEFNRIPTTVVAKLADNELDEIEELTQFDDEEDYREFLPMWGYMWTFNDNSDEEWAKRNVDVMQECGLRVYDSEEFGIIFGIDGAGYSFYEEHWIPLYKARGLQWHEYY